MAASKGNAAGQTEAKLYKSHRAIFFLHVPVTPSVHKKVTHRGHQWGPSLWAFESSHQCRKLSTGSAAVGILMVWVMWPPSMGTLGLQRTCGAGQDGATEQNTAAAANRARWMEEGSLGPSPPLARHAWFHGARDMGKSQEINVLSLSFYCLQNSRRLSKQQQILLKKKKVEKIKEMFSVSDPALFTSTFHHGT